MKKILELLDSTEENVIVENCEKGRTSEKFKGNRNLKDYQETKD